MKTFNHSVRKSTARNAVLLVSGTLLAGVTLGLSAHAQSLACNSTLTGPGDSVASLVARCGMPVSKVSVCVPAHRVTTLSGLHGQTIQQVEPVCEPHEDWTYFRAAGSFMAIVRVRQGAVVSVRDGEKPP